jgi:hypothetical protein
MNDAITKGLAFAEVQALLLERFKGIVPTSSWGEMSFFYNPKSHLPRGVYFCTLKDHDGANDQASVLGREGVYRLNFGIPAAAFERMFGCKPQRPPKGGVVLGPWNFTQLDTLMPHPVYGWMGWVAIMNPRRERFHDILPLLDLAYVKAVESYKKRLGPSAH